MKAQGSTYPSIMSRKYAVSEPMVEVTEASEATCTCPMPTVNLCNSQIAPISILHVWYCTICKSWNLAEGMKSIAKF